MGKVGVATATTAFEQQALKVLGDAWGSHYQIGHDDKHGWWAARHGRTKHPLKRDSPEELRSAIIEDHGAVRQ